MAFAGVAYRAQWQRHGDFTFGVQQESYDKNVLFPDLPAARLADHPLRAYGDAALALGERVTAYAGYTQGLEGGLFRPPPEIDECAVC